MPDQWTQNDDSRLRTWLAARAPTDLSPGFVDRIARIPETSPSSERALQPTRTPRLIVLTGRSWRLLAVAAVALATVGTVLVGGSAALRPALPAVVIVDGLWAAASEPALEIDRSPGDRRPLYWRASSYDTFTLRGWTTSAPSTSGRQANQALLADTLDAIPKTSAREDDTFVVTPASDVFHVAFSPIDPVSIDRSVTLNLAGDNGFLQSISVSGRDPYKITAAIPVDGDVQGGVTQNRLRAVDTDYPPAVLARYLGVPGGAMGPAARAVLAHVLDRVKTKTNNHATPYDVATEIVNELHDGNVYAYKTNILGLCDDSSSIVECFAQFKQGYCEHYASTMAILLRADNIPTRLVEGFLPGTLDPATGRESIRTEGAHAWVEVYFPSYGWQMFDPTGGGRAQAVTLPVDSFVPLPSATPRASLVVPSIGPNDRPRG
jgi:transglutaminase-like putative cysteine protease